MKSKFLILVFFSFLTSAWAEDKPIMLSHAAAKTSMTETENLALGKVLTDKGQAVEYYAPGNCSDSIRAWNNAGSKPYLLHYSSNMARAELLKGTPCTADMANAQIVQIKNQQSWLCSGPHPKPLNTPGLRIAYQMQWPGQDIVADINKLNQWVWKGVPVPGTNDGLIGLANGDFDYYFIIRSGVGDRVKNGQLVCHASSIPNDSIPYLNNVVKLSEDWDKTVTLHQLVVAKNLSPDQLKKVKDALDPSVNLELKKFLDFNDLKVEKIDPDTQKVFKDFYRASLDSIKKYSK